ncbi:hypothetical protein [Cyclobacterium jeungdonense]|uniref:Uncharacterized protein n=1 Tax=Cyclobacterium jeungdonense TaxID=708087 RepID=A0ABT8CAT6_9BACT|nr:hypothetical protein [Cyclobacterium jeungdonense]MDN3688723.1 hypothetical protein [Cyclobacterium jeungdonense]
MKRISFNFILALFLMAPFAVSFAQENKPIRFYDEDDASPIVGMHYWYGTQQGSSDTTGRVFLSFQKGASLRLDHIRYGTWYLTNTEFDRL